MAADSLPNAIANGGPVLRYGTMRRARRWRIAAFLTLIVLVPPSFWWSKSMLQQWSEDRARRVEIRYQVSTNLTAASTGIEREQWATAQIDIDRARLASDADPALFGASELRAFRRRIENTEDNMRAAQEHAMIRAEMDPHWRQLRDSRLANPPVCISSNVTADLNRTADRLLRHGRYSEALETLRQVLILDPDNAHAQERFPDALLERPSSDGPAIDE